MARRGGFRSMAEMQREREERESQVKREQSFYTGGTSSGLAVVDPTQRGGAAAAPGDAAVQRARADTAEASAAGDVPEGAIKVCLWKDGFTLDDGPLRPYDTEENTAFMRDLERGMMPKELGDRPEGMDVALLDKRSEAYVPPAAASSSGAEAQPSFAGDGQALRREGPASGLQPSDPTAQKPEVDEAQPVTSIQIRLADGARLVVKLNLTHRVADLRRAIDSAHPSSAPYALQLQFPRKRLDDVTVSIQEAGLVGASVMQIV